MKIYLLSGVDKYKGYNDILKRDISSEIKQINNLIGISANAQDFDKNDKMFWGNGSCPGIINMMKQCGIHIKEAHLIDERIDVWKVKEIVSNADVIYMLGGDPISQYEYIKKVNCIDVLKKFDGVILGVSAGAMNLSKEIRYFDEEDNSKIIRYEGLDISPVSIYPHFSIDNKILVSQLKELSQGSKIYALPNESYIKIKNNSPQFVGEYYLFYNGDYNKYN